MGKKNKFKKEAEPATPAGPAAGPQGTQGPSTSAQATSGPPQQGQQRQQGGGTPQQQGQQRGPGQQDGGTPQQQGQQRGPGKKGGGTPQQQGQQRGPGQQGGGTPQQQAWSQVGPRQQSGGTPQQKGQQRGPGQQGGGTPQQQAWSQVGPRQQGGGTPQQQGQQRGPGQQGGGTPQQKGWSQVGPRQQSGGTPQQQGQQRGPGQQGGGTPQQQGQQRGPGQQGDGTPQQQAWSQRGPGQQGGGTPQQQGQQRGPGQQGGGTPQQQGQQRGPGQKGGGTPQQQGWSQRGPGQQGGGTPQQQGWSQRGPGQQGGGTPQQKVWSQRGPGQQGGTPQQGQQRGYGGPPQQRDGGQSEKPGEFLTGDSISSAGIKRGTLGEKGEVGVNYLKIDISKMPSIAYHYDVTIEPDKPKKFLRDAFEEYRKKYLNNISAAYDGKKSCYSVQKLPLGNKFEEIEIIDSNSRKLHFKIDIKETDKCEIDLNSLRSYSNDRVFDKPMRALQCLEVALATPCHEKAVRAGRSFFKRPERGFDLGDGYEAWTGLYQAAILGDQPFLNVDISHKSFPKGMPVLQYIETYLFRGQRIDERDSLDNYKIRDLTDFIKGMNVIYKSPPTFGCAPRNFRVNGLSQESAIDLKFENENKEKVSIQDYFASKGYKLIYPRLQCLHVGSTARSIYVPIELCEIPEGQAINRKDASKQVQNMIKFAATSTNARKIKIMDLLLYFNHNAYRTIQNFGIQIGQQFISVPTRILESPMIEYFNRLTVRPYNGSWQMKDSMSFLQPKQTSTGHKWAIIHFKADYNLLVDFQNNINRQASILKVSLEKNALIIPGDNLDRTFQELKSKNVDLVFVVLPTRYPTYADVKQRAELKYGILTQCIKINTIQRRMSAMLIANVLLKVNCKLNGANHKIQDGKNIPLKNVMFLGADVTHPSPDQKFIPSVVGVAASHDQFGAMYNMQYRLQKSALEEIEDMESIITEHLKVYYNVQKRYPEHIIYYRDGVSDGQFPIVKSLELRAIQTATARLKIKVDLTCIIVVKRHHTRFFPHGQPAGNNKFNNVTPGTVVDRVIVHPNEMQFFMVSHQSIQGTAKPTRYNVIENTAKLDIDLLQTLTYNLCHMFPRCNRVVSYPAPAYLAHLVAFRGRVYLEGTTRFDEPQIEYKKRLVDSNFMKRNPMYFV